MKRLLQKSLLLTGLLALAIPLGCAPAESGTAENWVDIPTASRGLEGPSKLSPALQDLAGSAGGARDLNAPPPPSPEQVGYPMPGTTDVYEVAIETDPDIDIKALTDAGASILMRLDTVIYAAVSADNLPQVAEVDGVRHISPMPAPRIPKQPKGPPPSSDLGGARDLNSPPLDASNGDDHFDHLGLTGKGVMVGIIDTGIDWTHRDFRNPDGSTRLVAIWDVWDTTWADSNGTKGSKPPFDVEGKPLGTVYTTDQINLALQGKLKIPRKDAGGHGTACCGVATGNGLGTANSVPAATYVGVAPQADIIFVSTRKDDSKNPENDGAFADLGAAWIAQQSALRHEPVAVNLSFGGQYGAHDGSNPEELAYDKILNNGQLPGMVICASASNDGEEIIHARGHYGAAKEGVLYSEGSVDLNVTSETNLMAVLDSGDDWQLVVTGLDNYIVGLNKSPAHLRVMKDKSGNLAKQIWGVITPNPADLKIDSDLAQPDGKDLVYITLEPGAYTLGVRGNSEHVTKGLYDFYLPTGGATFGKGGDHKMVIGTPGTCNSVITVGSYDFRDSWVTATGPKSDTLVLGDLSSYSSNGFRVDGVIKPDIAGPGQWAISTLAVGSGMDEELYRTSDGLHLAWAGTSASCPFTVGVVALMLQKNPNLTANDVKKILRDTATHDDFTGAVPNYEWGYGKLNPTAAIKAVAPGAPLPAPTPTPTPPQPPVAPPFASTIPGAAFAGIFEGDGMTAEFIVNQDGSFTGTIQNNQTKCPLTAHFEGGRLEGTFHLQSEDYPFTAALDADKLVLETGSKVHVLMRKGAPWSTGMTPSPNDPGQSRDLGGGDIPQGLIFHSKGIQDPMINNDTAVTLLVPDGWTLQGQIVWNNDPFTMVSPVTFVSAPGGFPAVLTYPIGAYVDGIRQQRMQMYAPVGGADYMAQAFADGKFYMGKEIRLIVNPADYITKFLIPRYRSQGKFPLSQAQSVGVADCPEFAKLVAGRTGADKDPNAQYKAVRERFRYQYQGQTIDEDVYCALTAVPVTGGVVAWTANCVTFAAPEGTLDKNLPLLVCIVQSIQPELKWFNAILQVQQMMEQNIAEATANEGALSRYIAHVNDQISDIITKGYEEREKIDDACFSSFDTYIRGLDDFVGPDGHHVQLPSGHKWYADGEGGYHAVDPGEPADPGWTPLKGGGD